jgi:flagellar biogenesis protein FliO
MAALVFGLLGVLLLVAVSEAWVIIRLRRGPSGRGENHGRPGGGV